MNLALAFSFLLYNPLELLKNIVERKKEHRAFSGNAAVFADMPGAYAQVCDSFMHTCDSYFSDDFNSWLERLLAGLPACRTYLAWVLAHIYRRLQFP